MSVTELQVIQRVIQRTTTETMSSKPCPGRFLLPKEDGDQADLGLVMRIDGGLKGGRSIVPVSSICGQTKAFAQIALWTASLLHSVRNAISSRLNHINDWIYEQVSKLLPVLVYLSLLVLILQFSALVFLVAISQKSIGFLFLLSCIALLVYAYTYSMTASEAPRRLSTSKIPSSTATPVSLTPSSSTSSLNCSAYY